MCVGYGLGAMCMVYGLSAIYICVWAMSLVLYMCVVYGLSAMCVVYGISAMAASGELLSVCPLQRAINAVAAVKRFEGLTADPEGATP